MASIGSEIKSLKFYSFPKNIIRNYFPIPRLVLFVNSYWHKEFCKSKPLMQASSDFHSSSQSTIRNIRTASAMFTCYSTYQTQTRFSMQFIPKNSHQLQSIIISQDHQLFSHHQHAVISQQQQFQHSIMVLTSLLSTQQQQHFSHTRLTHASFKFTYHPF